MTTQIGWPQLPPATRRRLLIVALSRGFLAVAALCALYFALPLERLAKLPLWLTVTAGVLVLAAITAYEVRAVVRATYPVVRAIQALTLIVPLFLLLFAATYFVLSQADASNFNVAALTRADALYFTVTVFATVGFGDIVARSQPARVLVTVQMILDLILLGAVIRAFVEAVRVARDLPEN
jgi:hypothetical protein